MQDIAPGRTIAGRYLLEERRLTSDDGIQVWRAVDQTLQAEVRITVIPQGLPHAEAVVDAARRAAGVQDHRLVQILDIGVIDGMSWIVEEHHSGARTLAELVAENPLDGEQTRTVLGELASALAVAGGRGLHHLRLTPHSVLITARGEVRLSGLGTVVALEGADEPPAERADLLDCLGLLALAYYAMTTRWPLPRQVPGIDPAPHVVGGVPAPSEIAAGVPADLDLLCRTALNGRAGPRTPADLAADVAPWQPRVARGDEAPVTAVLPRLGSDTTDTLSAPDADAAGLPAQQSSPASAGDAEPQATDLHATNPQVTNPQVTNPQVTDPQTVPIPVGNGADPLPGSLAGSPAGPVDGPGQPPPTGTPVAPEPATAPEAGAIASTEAATAPLAETAATSPVDAAADPASPPSPASGTDPGSAADDGAPSGEKTTKTAAAASMAGAAAGRVTARLGTFARAAADKAALARAESARRREQTRTDATDLSGFHPRPAPYEPPGPLLPFTEGERPGTHSGLVLAIVAVVVVVAVTLSSLVVFRGLAGSEPATDPTPDQPNATSAAPTQSTRTTQPITIRSGTTYDPYGDGSENNNYVPRAFDGDPATRWISEQYYSNPNWGGSQNRGVGIVFRMPKDTSLTSVTLDFADTSQTATLYVANSPRDLSSATRIGTVEDATGSVTVEATDAPPAEYVYVWFTRANRDGNGWRVSLNEIRLEG